MMNTTTTSNDVERPKEDVVESENETEQPPDMLSAAGLLVSTIVLLVAVVSKGKPSKGDAYWRYGITLSVVAMFFALVFLSGVMDDRSVFKNPKIPLYLNYFVFAWCFIGACIMTFGDGPFVVTSNGYFAAWGVAIFSVLELSKASAVGNVRDNFSSLMGHLVASIIVIIAVSSEGFDNWKSEAIYGLVLACCSVLLVGLIHLNGREGINEGSTGVTYPFFAILSLCWIVSASLLTFRGPFDLTGNGYFGSWAGAVTAIYCTLAAKRNWEIS
jgi:hypothetical protein